jgi:adenylate cyclase
VAIDFEAEGLLDGVEGEAARRARLELLERLHADGVPLEELRRAVAEQRLALLPLERILGGEGARYSPNEVAAKTGLDREFLDATWRALGMALADPDEPYLTDDDLDAARVTATFVEAGVPREALLQITRVLGHGMANLAATVNQFIGEALVQPGDTELDLALRWSEAARELGPQLEPLLVYVLNVHRRDQARHAVVSAADLEAGRIRGARWVTVGFADLVGFTRLGEQVPAGELGAVAGRLAELAGDAAEPPVRLVKTIGDAAMLASPDPDALLEASLALLEAAGAEGDDFPQVRAGVAAGEAVTRAADWYGRPVNLASRLTGVARPGSVLTDSETFDAARAAYHWTRVGNRRFKGIRGETLVYRVRRSG